MGYQKTIISKFKHNILTRNTLNHENGFGNLFKT